MKTPVIGIPLGDPSGVGPEIALKAQLNPEVDRCCIPVLVGPMVVAEDIIRRFNMPVKLRLLPADLTPVPRPDPRTVWLRDTGPFPIDQLSFGTVQGISGQAAHEAIVACTAETLSGRFDAMATTPINKEALRAAHVAGIGHTEILGELTGVADPLTLFQTRELRVFFLTRHVSLRQACDLVTRERVERYGRACVDAMKRLGFASCRLAIAGLNPHSGEHGLFGDEEGKAIVPAVETLRAEGYDVVGPLSADSVFHQAAGGAYDAVLSLYHDQGHIAAKMYDFARTISLTLGLPFLRASVDHGTAFDIAGKGTASAVSMEEAIFAAARYGISYRESGTQANAAGGSAT